MIGGSGGEEGIEGQMSQEEERWVEIAIKTRGEVEQTKWWK